jgi:hypothetical protein
MTMPVRRARALLVVLGVLLATTGTPALVAADDDAYPLECKVLSNTEDGRVGDPTDYTISGQLDDGSGFVTPDGAHYVTAYGGADAPIICRWKPGKRPPWIT